MAQQNASAAKKNTIEATLIRCGCPKRLTNEQKIERHGRDPATGGILPCPTPRKVANLGVLSYYHEGHPVETALVTALIRVKRFIFQYKEK